MQIYGNTHGLSPSQTKALERLYRRRVPFDSLTTPELTRSLVETSFATGRQVGVLVDRSGTVSWVIVGDASQLMLPDIGRLRGAEGRFRGLRLIHIHLHTEPLTRDDLVDLTRLRLDMVVAICLSPDGKPQTVYWGHNVPVRPGERSSPHQTYGPTPYQKADVNPKAIVLALEEEFARVAKTRQVEAKDGRAILVHVCDKRHASRAEDSLAELAELARTAGVEVADTVLQVRDQVDPKYVLGKGKLEQVVIRAMQLDVEVLIIDRNLSPRQGAAIAQMTDLKVLDRTQLILDIFAQRAESRDGKLQVELAQMHYLLPRLGAKDDGLSRLAGGIGGRGPGETKLEVGKRRARERITRLKSALKKLAKQRKQRRQRRSRRGVPVVAVVGYTNAGKSTLLNQLTESNVLVEDKLFATLDTRSRRIRFPEEREVVITDTVGFIRDLPKDLFNAFRATFEEAADADLILHVVDVSDDAFDEHMKTTEELLAKLDLDRAPRLLVCNKADAVEPGHAHAIAEVRGGVAVSALDRESLRPLLARLEEFLFPSDDALVSDAEGGADADADADAEAEAEAEAETSPEAEAYAARYADTDADSSEVEAETETEEAALPPGTAAE
ncbi:MAG: GTPase HflX [Deltaproteobacteria bacterium]|nr:GTPase HflX [Deltaproteobacteria bacterium]